MLVYFLITCWCFGQMGFSLQAIAKPPTSAAGVWDPQAETQQAGLQKALKYKEEIFTPYIHDYWTEEDAQRGRLASPLTAESRIFTTLIIVPCHTIYVGTEEAPSNLELNTDGLILNNPGLIPTYFKEGWILEEYQRYQLSHFQDHIKAGVELASRDLNALLVISGGQTRPSAGSISEAIGYYLYAQQQHWFNYTNEPSKRTIIEEYARDSFENLLFSICRFREYTGKYPYKIIVVGFPFKSWRFEHLHRATLRFPKERFQYVGIVSSTNSSLEPYSSPEDTMVKIQTFLPKSIQRRPEESQDVDVDSDYDKDWPNYTNAIEKDVAIPLFEQDPKGCLPGLANKKMNRNPNIRIAPYALTCSDMVEFLSC